MKFDKTQLLDQYFKYLYCLWFRCLAKKSYQQFQFKNCLFGATNIVKNSDKEKHVYSGYRTMFDSAGSWSFDNDFSRNSLIFGVNDS